MKLGRYILAAPPDAHGPCATEMALLRSDFALDHPPTPYWDWISSDINAGRGGYLYILVKTDWL